MTILPDGPGRLDALLRLIDDARHTLRVVYYIYADDAAGRRVRDALERAAERGVKVALIVDGFGVAAAAGFFTGLRDRGADVCRYLPKFGRRYLLRNHQKLVLADERVVLIGGFNVENGYFGSIADGAWRDLGLLVEGPAAARIAPYFDALLHWAQSDRRRFRELRAILTRHSEIRGPVRWLFGGPTRRLSPWARSLKADMDRGRRLTMIAGYFAPNPGMMRRIERVATRGGTARLMTAARSDNNATIAAARHCYRRLLKRGVEVLEYGATKLHTKLFVVDDSVHLGSANFDVRSLFLNLELMLRVEDPAFAEHMRDYFDGEAEGATRITAEAHARTGLIRRIQWSVAYFIVAVLDGNITRRLNFGIDGQ